MIDLILYSFDLFANGALQTTDFLQEVYYRFEEISTDPTFRSILLRLVNTDNFLV